MSKKLKIVFLFLVIGFTQKLFSQQNITVDITDDVYSFLEIAEEKGYCEKLSYNKPYTQNYIIKQLNNIIQNIENNDYKFKDNELETAKTYLNRYEKSEGFNPKKMSYRHEDNSKENFPVSFEFNISEQLFVSSGIYTDSNLNSTGFEFFQDYNVLGDLGNNASYRMSAYNCLTQMDLQKVGSDYEIGYWWYDGWKWEPEKNKQRTINTYRNNSTLPYSYKKGWDGSIYYLTNVTSSGLEGWPFVPAFGFGMYGELRANFLDEMITVGLSRTNREWAGMDAGSSLVYNQSAAPFFAFDAGIKLFDWLSFQTLTGIMEFPNAEYIDENAWYRITYDENGNVIEDTSITNYVDSYFFQNAYSIGMFNFDTKYIHFDFGSTCIWPKRFELGYMFPLIDRVIYQNSVGDFDNLALFGDLKGTIPGVGSLWLSGYIEELNCLTPKLFLKTRCMFAFQGGAKVNIPFLPFATLSTRYTKIEPYCYTHQALKKQPWYSGYISESYTNNGKSLGYYLEPNSDEIFVRLDTKPAANTSLALQYQFIRHGADYGSGQVRGSSIWSELPIGNRDKYNKYFLHDGAYEWSHIIQLEGKYNIKNIGIPLQVTCNIGYLYDYFTMIDGTPNSNKSYPYHKINTAEYPVKQGVVLSLGVRLFSFDICQ